MSLPFVEPMGPVIRTISVEGAEVSIRHSRKADGTPCGEIWFRPSDFPGILDATVQAEQGLLGPAGSVYLPRGARFELEVVPFQGGVALSIVREESNGTRRRPCVLRRGPALEALQFAIGEVLRGAQ